MSETDMSFHSQTLFNGPDSDNEDSNQDRFELPTDEDVNQLLLSQRNENTVKNTKWAMKCFDDWCKHYERKFKQQVPLILTLEAPELNMWLGRFVYGAKQANGKDYCTKSLYGILAGIRRFLLENDRQFNVFDKKDLRFHSFREMVDAKLKELTKKGKARARNTAQPVSHDDERILWQSGQFGDHCAESLLYTMYFYNCKLFGLRSRNEHRELQKEQFAVGQSSVGYWVEFDGRTSKNLKGGLKQINIDPKKVRHTSLFEADPNIVQHYMQYLDAIEEGPFYRKPLSNMGNLLRFGLQPVGVNSLSKIMTKICENAGIGDRKYTGHSGKVTCATALYQNGIDPQLIMDRTGHRSEAVKRYKHASQEMQVSVSQCLEPPSKKKISKQPPYAMNNNQSEMKHGNRTIHRTEKDQIEPDPYDLGFDVDDDPSIMPNNQDQSAESNRKVVKIAVNDSILDLDDHMFQCSSQSIIRDGKTNAALSAAIQSSNLAQKIPSNAAPHFNGPITGCHFHFH